MLWENGAEYEIAVKYVLARAAQQEERTETVTHHATAPASGGNPLPGWREMRLLVLCEDYGLERTNEPVTVFLSAPGTEVTSWAREARVLRYEPDTGSTCEIPSQVLFERQAAEQPSGGTVHHTGQLAFIADVPAGGRSFYLIFYGNPAAEPPDYPTRLDAAFSEAGRLTGVETTGYEAVISPVSGQIAALHSKAFGDLRGFSASDLPLDYAPDIWPTGRNWMHVSNWNPPPNETVTVGPVAVVTRRWGPLPDCPEVRVDVTYTFFDGAPYILIDSTMRIAEDVVSSGLRIQEFVVKPPEVVDHMGWCTKSGRRVYKPCEPDPSLSVGMIGLVESDSPYVCMTNHEKQVGVGAVLLHLSSGTSADAPAVMATDMVVLADYSWGFRYWTRVLAFPWGDTRADHPIVLNKGTYYTSRSAVLVFPVGDGDAPEEKMAALVALDYELRRPLRIDRRGAGPW